MEFANKFDEVVTVPDACRSCVLIQRLREMHDSLDAQVQGTLEAYSDDTLNQGLIQSGMDIGMSLDEATQIVLGNPEGVSQLVSAGVEGAAALRDGTARFANKMVYDCPGVLRMRATRAGRQVTAAVCMSEVVAARSLHNGGVEPVGIERKDV